MKHQARGLEEDGGAVLVGGAEHLQPEREQPRHLRWLLRRLHGGKHEYTSTCKDVEKLEPRKV